MQSPQSKWPGIAMALASAILFSTLAIFVKLAYRQQLTVNAVVVLRMAFGSIFLWLTLLFNRRERASWRIAAADWPALIGGVILTYGISEFTYFTGLQLLPAGVAIFLIYLYPVLVVFITYVLYREPPTRRKIGVAAVCFLGCAILSFKPDGGFSFSGWGIFLILFSALCIALYSAFSQKLLKNYSPTVISTWTVTPVGTVFLLIDSPNLSGYLNFPAAAWLIMLGAAFFATFVSLILFFRAVVRIGAAHTALLSTIEPVSTALLATWILGEQMSRWQMLGAALILGGLVILEWPAKEQFNLKRKAENFATPIST
jgi:drug/metabolite transporter (DMT)-like permease